MEPADLFAAIVENSGAAIISKDIDGIVLSWNRAAEQIFGWSAEEWIANPDGGLFWFNRRWLEYTDLTPTELQGMGWQKILHPDHIERVSAKIKLSVEAGEDWEDTFPLIGKDGQFRWFLSRAAPQRDPTGKVKYWFGSATDITEQRDAERRIEVLLMEVNHRSKNLLSVVQAMARRTASTGEDFIPRLERRIAALATNQDVLVERNWTAIPLRELIEAQLLFLEQADSQTELSGTHVIVQPGTAEALSMTLHELATNAEKYGAYSVPAGTVRISWDISGTAAEAEFVLRWTESGGPMVVQTNQPGFGSRIIRDVPSGRLRGEVETEYAPQGFRFTLRCPAANVLATLE
jgi:PAS domain S-box-containing protein